VTQSKSDIIPAIRQKTQGRKPDLCGADRASETVPSAGGLYNGVRANAG